MNGLRFPVATLILIAANLAAAFLVTLQPELLDRVQFDPARPAAGPLLLSLFFHLNLLHLLGNMVFLAAVGAAVELATGTLRFVSVYLVGGIAGAFAHWIAVRGAVEPAPLLGASGCIAACVGYYAIRYLAMRVPLAPKVPTPIGAIIGVWVGLQILGAFVQVGQSQVAVSYWAHLGGFLAGLLMSVAFRAPDLQQIEFKNEALRKMNERGPAATLAAARQVLAEHPDDRTALDHAAEAAETLGDHDAEQGFRERLFQLAETAEAAVVQYRRLRALGRKETPADLAKLAHRFQEADPRLARELLEEALAQDPQHAPDLLLDLASVTQAHDPVASKAYLDRLASEHGLSPAAEAARQRGWLQ